MFHSNKVSFAKTKIPPTCQRIEKTYRGYFEEPSSVFPFMVSNRSGVVVWHYSTRDLRISHPLMMVSSGAANEMRKQERFSENTLPGIINTLFSIAFLTN